MSIHPEKPNVLPVLPKNIPDELKALDHWVVWRLERAADDRWTKVPYIPGQLRRASSTNPQSWRPFAMALADIGPKRKGRDGIGFVLTLDAGLVVVDLDHVVSADSVGACAQATIDRFGSYAELSSSGTGVHIWCKGVLPDQKKGGRKGGIEIYSAGRFITVTGQPTGGAR